MPGTFSPAFFTLGVVFERAQHLHRRVGRRRPRRIVLPARPCPTRAGATPSRGQYEQSLRDKGLPNAPLYTTPLLYRKKGYEGMDEETRKRLLSSFRIFFRHLPIRHACLALDTKEFTSPDDVTVGMRRALVGFMFDHLEYLQGFDDIRVHYDDGQHSIARAIHGAAEYALSKNAVILKKASPADYRLGQAADYICTVELATLRYRDKRTTATDEKFFGSRSRFRRVRLKDVRAKRLRRPRCKHITR